MHNPLSIPGSNGIEFIRMETTTGAPYYHQNGWNLAILIDGRLRPVEHIRGSFAKTWPEGGSYGKTYVFRNGKWNRVFMRLGDFVFGVGI